MVKKLWGSSFVCLAIAASLIPGLFYKPSAAYAFSGARYFSVNMERNAFFEITNENSNNAVTVTYSAYPDSVTQTAKAIIYKYNDATGRVAGSTFNISQRHTETFRLPAGAVYYVLIKPYPHANRHRELSDMYID